MKTRPLATPQNTAQGHGVYAAMGATLALVLMLLTQWPATWVASGVRQLSGGRVLLVDSQGSLWQGSAHIALSTGESTASATAWTPRLHWQIAATALNTLEIRWRTSESTGTSSWVWRLQWQPGGLVLTMSDMDWRLPTAWLSGWGAPWNTIQPEGELRLQTRQWRWQQNGHQWRNDGQLSLHLLGLSTRLSSLRPLGDYKLQWMGGDAPKITLETLQGPLQMSGQGQWLERGVVFEGEAWAEHPSDEIALTNLLSVLGNRKGTRAILKMG